ncbi:MAG: rRNA methyltransferase, partial [Jiangellaceae bacterium]
MPAVARIEHITDSADARLADYVSLRDVELRMSVEAEHGLFLAEGEKVVRRAVESGY